MKPEYYFNAFVLCLVIALGVGYWHSNTLPIEIIEEPEETVDTKIVFDLDPVLLGAKGVLVVDMKNDEILFSQNATVPYPLASLSKIVASLVALEDIPQEPITITRESIVQSGDKGLRVGEQWDIDELVQFMLVTSSNDAAYAIASSVGQDDEPITQNFTRMMNTYVRNLGMSDTYFLSPTGLDDDFYGVTGYGTAHDIYALMNLATSMFPEVFLSSSMSDDWFTSRDNFVHKAKNTNTVADNIPSLIFSKTGYTDDAGGNLAFMFEYGPHHPIGVIILSSTFEGRFDDALTIIQSFQSK
jgi:D-alanyl-D-alanine carboxypeptidase